MALLIEYRHARASAILLRKDLLLSMTCTKTLIHKEGII